MVMLIFLFYILYTLFSVTFLNLGQDFSRRRYSPTGTPVELHFGVSGYAESDIFHHLTCIHLHHEEILDGFRNSFQAPPGEGIDGYWPEKSYFHALIPGQVDRCPRDPRRGAE